MHVSRGQGSVDVQCRVGAVVFGFLLLGGGSGSVTSRRGGSGWCWCWCGCCFGWCFFGRRRGHGRGCRCLGVGGAAGSCIGAGAPSSLSNTRADFLGRHVDGGDENLRGVGLRFQTGRGGRLQGAQWGPRCSGCSRLQSLVLRAMARWQSVLRACSARSFLSWIGVSVVVVVWLLKRSRSATRTATLRLEQLRDLQRQGTWSNSVHSSPADPPFRSGVVLESQSLVQHYLLALFIRG